MKQIVKLIPASVKRYLPEDKRGDLTKVIKDVRAFWHTDQPDIALLNPYVDYLVESPELIASLCRKLNHLNPGFPCDKHIDQLIFLQHIVQSVGQDKDFLSANYNAIPWWIRTALSSFFKHMGSADAMCTRIETIHPLVNNLLRSKIESLLSQKEPVATHSDVSAEIPEAKSETVLVASAVLSSGDDSVAMTDSDLEASDDEDDFQEVDSWSDEDDVLYGVGSSAQLPDVTHDHSDLLAEASDDEDDSALSSEASDDEDDFQECFESDAAFAAESFIHGVMQSAITHVTTAATVATAFVSQVAQRAVVDMVDVSSKKPLDDQFLMHQVSCYVSMFHHRGPSAWGEGIKLAEKMLNGMTFSGQYEHTEVNDLNKQLEELKNIQAIDVTAMQRLKEFLGYLWIKCVSCNNKEAKEDTKRFTRRALAKELKKDQLDVSKIAGLSEKFQRNAPRSSRRSCSRGG